MLVFNSISYFTSKNANSESFFLGNRKSPWYIVALGIISAIIMVAEYIYEPLLGMYAFELFTKYKTKDKYVPLVAIVSPVICYVLKYYSQIIFGGY
ncbi:MAG: hypothetical protein GQ564_05855 [Bacteroidales bacterium]|nr:hypothetical protein [Bacteroidales bacterium]